MFIFVLFVYTLALIIWNARLYEEIPHFQRLLLLLIFLYIGAGVTVGVGPSELHPPLDQITASGNMLTLECSVYS